MTEEQLLEIADLAKLRFNKETLKTSTAQINEILQFVAQLNEVNSEQITPMAHPLDMYQRLREDVVSETNNRLSFQSIAPAVREGFYLVPTVIE